MEMVLMEQPVLTVPKQHLGGTWPSMLCCRDVLKEAAGAAGVSPPVGLLAGYHARRGTLAVEELFIGHWAGGPGVNTCSS